MAALGARKPSCKACQTKRYRRWAGNSLRERNRNRMQLRRRMDAGRLGPNSAGTVAYQRGLLVPGRPERSRRAMWARSGNTLPIVTPQSKLRCVGPLPKSIGGLGRDTAGTRQSPLPGERPGGGRHSWRGRPAGPRTTCTTPLLMPRGPIRSSTGSGSSRRRPSASVRSPAPRN